jgi:hypothetical protein
VTGAKRVALLAFWRAALSAAQWADWLVEQMAAAMAAQLAHTQAELKVA